MEEDTISKICLLCEDALFQALSKNLHKSIKAVPLSMLDEERWREICRALASGDHLIFIGGERLELLQSLWIRCYKPLDTRLSMRLSSAAPIELPSLSFHPAKVWGVAISPPKPPEKTFHGIDEEPRADIFPIFEALDRFGQPVCYSSMMLRNYDGALVTGRFSGSQWFIFLFDKPLEACEVQGWETIIHRIFEFCNNDLQISYLGTEFASYRPDERASIRCRITNHRDSIVSVLTRFFLLFPEENSPIPLNTVRCCINPSETIEFSTEWRVGKRHGLWRIQAKLYLEDLQMFGRSREELAQYIETRECGVMVSKPGKGKPFHQIKGATMKLDGRSSFWIGTHYYPSSVWWDGTWRDLRLGLVDRDLMAMRQMGIRFLRIWVAPILDESSLRAMDAVVYLCQKYKIIPIVTMFTQWVRKIGYTRPNGEHVLFDFRGERGFNVYSISLRNISLQKEYTSVLASRWRRIPSLIWNLTNEVWLMNPDDDQLDKSIKDKLSIKEYGPRRDVHLFLLWAEEIVKAIREAGSRHPIISGYAFIGGVDSYLQNALSDIMPWHDYRTPDVAGKHLVCYDATGRDQPVILEEFGINTVDENLREKHYDAIVHYALAARAACACSYEWGVSWLTRELPHMPTAIKDISRLEPQDPRWFLPIIEGAGSEWPTKSLGICPWAGSFVYGMIYHGTPFPTPACRAFSRLALFGDELGYVPKEKRVYLAVPMEFGEFTPFYGYPRKMERLTATIERLWQEKVDYSVVQEDLLQEIPSSAEVVIFPSNLPLKEETRVAFDKLESRGVEVYLGEDESWVNSPGLERIEIVSSSRLQVMTRDTERGKLYCLFSMGNKAQVELRTKNNRIAMEINDYGLVHESEGKFVLLEGTGNLVINKKKILNVEGSRVLVKSVSKEGLLKSNSILLATEGPANITFTRPITRVQVLRFGMKGLHPVSEVPLTRIGTKSLVLDKDLSQHIVKITFFKRSLQGSRVS